MTFLAKKEIKKTINFFFLNTRLYLEFEGDIRIYYSIFIVFPIRVYSLPYVVLGFLLTTHCLSINRNLCNIVIMNNTQYNVVHYSLPLFLSSIYFSNIFHIVSKLFNTTLEYSLFGDIEKIKTSTCSARTRLFDKCFSSSSQTQTPWKKRAKLECMI